MPLPRSKNYFFNAEQERERKKDDSAAASSTKYCVILGTASLYQPTAHEFIDFLLTHFRDTLRLTIDLGMIIPRVYVDAATADKQRSNFHPPINRILQNLNT